MTNGPVTLRDSSRAEPSRDVEALLDEIEREAIPERLLALATELQTALARQRDEERPEEAGEMRQRAAE